MAEVHSERYGVSDDEADIERVRLVEFGVVSEADGSTLLAQVREPGFAMLSPTSIATVGRKPAAI